MRYPIFNLLVLVALVVCKDETLLDDDDDEVYSDGSGDGGKISCFSEYIDCVKIGGCNNKWCASKLNQCKREQKKKFWACVRACGKTLNKCGDDRMVCANRYLSCKLPCYRH